MRRVRRVGRGQSGTKRAKNLRRTGSIVRGRHRTPSSANVHRLAEEGRGSKSRAGGRNACSRKPQAPGDSTAVGPGSENRDAFKHLVTKLGWAAPFGSHNGLGDWFLCASPSSPASADSRKQPHRGLGTGSPSDKSGDGRRPRLALAHMFQASCRRRWCQQGFLE